MINMPEVAVRFGKVVAKNCPIICAAAGIGFMGLAIYEAIKATPKAMEVKKELDKRGETKKFNYLKALTPCYWKSIAMFATGTGFTIGSNYISARRLSVATGTAELAGIALEETRRAIRDVAGEEMEAKIMDEVGHHYHVEYGSSDMPCHGNGEILIRDGVLGGTFRSSVNEVGATFNEVQAELLDEDRVSTNRFLDLFDRPPISKGDDEGWSRILHPDEKIEIRRWDHDIDKVTGEPCLVLYYTEPYEDFDKNF